MPFCFLWRTENIPADYVICMVTTGRVLCWISNGGHQLTLLDFSTRLFHRDLPVKTKLQGIIPTNFQSQPCILAWDFKGNIFIVDSTVSTIFQVLGFLFSERRICWRFFLADEYEGNFLRSRDSGKSFRSAVCPFWWNGFALEPTTWRSGETSHCKSCHDLREALSVTICLFVWGFQI